MLVLRSMKLGTSLLVTCFAVLSLPAARALNIDLTTLGVGYYAQGGSTLANTSTTDWFYGCSPTAVGMAMGYYDQNGYAGGGFSNLIPGGVAPAQSIAPNPSILKSAIASLAYVNDYYSGSTYAGTYWNGNNGSYGLSGDDVGTHAASSIADFMGTSQDSIGNSNGATSFYYFADGSKLHYTDALNYGFQDYDGMYGITEYVSYCGYNVADAYTQLSSNASSSGFSYGDFKAEIDAGRPVIIQVSGHTMLGVGYDGLGNISINNTWDQGTYSMAWGGSYSGMEMWGVTVFELSGGSHNTPDGGASLGLLTIGILFLIGFGRKMSA